MVELRTFDSSPATVVSDGGGDSPSPGYPSAAPHPPRNGTSVGTGHDNDNDDVTRNGVSNHDDNDGGGSPYGDAGSRVRQDDNGSPCGEAGRRVRLVGLLGDLDLEVEFCSPHAPLPPSPSQHSGTDRNGHNATRRGPADEGGAPVGEVSQDPASFRTPAPSWPPPSSDQVFAEKEDSMESGGVGPTLSLPAPATAKRSSGDDRSAGSGLEPSLWRAGEESRAPEYTIRLNRESLVLPPTWKSVSPRGSVDYVRNCCVRGTDSRRVRYLLPTHPDPPTKWMRMALQHFHRLIRTSSLHARNCLPRPPSTPNDNPSTVARSRRRQHTFNLFCVQVT